MTTGDQQRAGPKAIVTLTCDGCAYYREFHMNWSDYCVAAMEHCSGGPRSLPPSIAKPHRKCPFSPGDVVGVPVASLGDGLQRLIDAARDLGQEIQNAAACRPSP